MGAKNSRDKRSERIERSKIETGQPHIMKVSKNVIIFGETGVGKSSVINMLRGNKEAKVSNSAIGCTFKSKMYPYEDYVFYDTVGLNEGKAGKVSNKVSTNMLIKLLKSLEDGINLLVLVMKLGRVTETIQNNYSLFYEVMARKKVPLILVVTHCDMIDNEWWVENEKNFKISDDHKMEITDCLCICATDGEEPGIDPSMVPAGLKTKYKDCRVKLMDLIDKHVLEYGWCHEDFIDWGHLVIKRFLNLIYEEEGPVEYWPELKVWLKDVFKLSDEEAIKRSNRILLDQEEVLQ